MGSYKVLIKKSAAKELESIAGTKDRERIARGSREDREENSRVGGRSAPAGRRKLSGGSEKYCIRQGNFRILYEIQDDVLIVTVVRIADRKEAYRK